MSPKKLSILGLSYNQHSFKRDLIAGLTIFVMLVPQGMAYAMLTGLPPVMGLYASTIPLIIYALLASSRHLSVGPVAITSLLVFSSVSVIAETGSSEYISYVLILALMVGAIQLLLGMSKAGFIVKFIPHSVMNGYTSAAAIVIGLSQLKHVLGIEAGNYLQIHVLFTEVFQHLSDVHLLTVGIGIGSMLGLVLFKKINPKIPGALLIVILSIAMVYVFGLHHSGVQIVGDVPQGFPAIALPPLSIEVMQLLFPMALTISLIAFMESLAIAKAIANKEKYKVNPNRELRALGLSNIVGACFHSFPVNGSFSRTAVNYQAGGVTQMASMITAMLVMVTLFFFTSFFYYLPNAILAAIIMVAVYKLIDLKEMRHLFQVKPFEGWIWVTTFFVTLFVGIQWGIIIGAAFTLILLVKQSARPNIVELGYVKKENAFRDTNRYPKARTIENVLLIRVDSSLHFANIAFFEEKIKAYLKRKPKAKWIIVDMAGVNDMDTVSVGTLEELIVSYRKEYGVTFVFANMKGAIRDTVKKAGWTEKYKDEIKYPTIEQVVKEKGFDYHSEDLIVATLDYQI
ncbi:SulP family inorganic anion transporter [Halalkalibacter flavus]|uniref:SulP family inorganic anion transporter n=1 Tax=Halalkalibacter flavus TaxID=3090668 RepID=UPI002FCB15EC